MLLLIPGLSFLIVDPSTFMPLARESMGINSHKSIFFAFYVLCSPLVIAFSSQYGLIT